MQCLEALAFEFPNPAFVNFMEWHRVKVVKFFAPMPDYGNEVGILQLPEVLGDGLACHVHVLAECGECLAVVEV